MPVPIILPPGPRRVVIAPDAFKGSLSSARAAEALAAGVRDALPDAEVRVLPLADGGDGTVDALIRAGYERCTAPARGPTGMPGQADYAVSDGAVVVELAGACGLALLPDGRPDPLGASTLGLGDVIRQALAEETHALVICLGGSASTDGGAGLLVALGARLLDDAGQQVPAGGGHLHRVALVDLSGLPARLREIPVRVATDVRSPLLGPTGAAQAFAPQKGADPEQVRALESGLAHWADVLADATGVDARTAPGSGAAGGTGLAAIAALHGEVVSGADLVRAALGMEAALEWCDLVVTGEGALDRTTLEGKGVGSLAAAARARGIPVVAACGRVDLGERERRAAGIIAAVGLTDVVPAQVDPMTGPEPWLAQAARQLVAQVTARS